MSGRSGALFAGSLFVVVAAVCFGTLGPVSRLASEAGVATLGFVTWRSLVGAVVLGSWLLVLRVRGARLVDLRRIPRREAAVLVSAGVASALLNVAIFVAFQRIPIALALLGFYTYPAMVGVLIAVTGRERLDLARVLALLMAMGGMALVVLGQLGSSGAEARLDLLGIALALFAAGCNVVYIIGARGGYPSVPGRQATFVVLLVNVACFALIGLATGGLASITAPLGEPAAWPWLLFAGTVGAALPSVLFMAGVRRIGAVRTSIVMLLEPVVGAILAALLLREPLVAIQVAGGALVLSGAGLAEGRSSRVADSGMGPAIAEAAAD